MSNMATSLIMHKRISTTLAKAKELRKFVEPLVTRSKHDTTHSRRVVFSELQNKYAVTELFREISQKVSTRPGGYTRILKTGFRKGDNAEMCIIEFVDYNETYTTEGGKKKATRTRRGSGKKAAAKVEEAPVAEAVEETAPVAEAEAPAAE
jgi:large subunit ribosomal protein L17